MKLPLVSFALGEYYSNEDPIVYKSHPYFVCACDHVSKHAVIYVCVCAHARAYVRACVCVHAHMCG